MFNIITTTLYMYYLGLLPFDTTVTLMSFKNEMCKNVYD